MYDRANEPSKLRARNLVEINDESRETHNVSNQDKFVTSVKRSNLCGYSDENIHFKETLTVSNTSAQGAAPYNRN